MPYIELPNFKHIVLIENPYSTKADDADSNLDSILQSTGLKEINVTRERYFPTTDFFDEYIRPDTLLALHSGDGGQRAYVEEFTKSDSGQTNDATLLFLPGGNGLNAARDTGTSKKIDMSKSRVARLHLGDYKIDNPNGDEYDSGIFLTTFNIGSAALASQDLELYKPLAKRFGPARLLPEAFVAARAAFQQTPFGISYGDKERSVCTANFYLTPKIAKNTIGFLKQNVSLETSSAIFHAPEVSNRRTIRGLQTAMMIAGIPLGILDKSIIDLSVGQTPELHLTINSDVPVLAGIDGETRVHHDGIIKPLVLDDGATVTISEHPRTYRMLSVSKQK